MKCEIIRDLLPLYCDKLTSQVSSEEIEKHLEDCKECAEVYGKMSAESSTAVGDVNIEPLKKVRRKNKLKIIAGFLSGALLLGIVFAFAFVGVIPASSEDVSVTYSGEILEDGTISIDFYLETETGWALNSKGRVLWSVAEDYKEETGTLYKVFMFPFDYRGVDANIFNADFFAENGKVFGDRDTYTIKFRDGEVTYYLKDIAEELGLQ